MAANAQIKKPVQGQTTSTGPLAIVNVKQDAVLLAPLKILIIANVKEIALFSEIVTLASNGTDQNALVSQFAEMLTLTAPALRFGTAKAAHVHALISQLHALLVKFGTKTAANVSVKIKFSVNLMKSGMKIAVDANARRISPVPQEKYGIQIHANVFALQLSHAIPLLTLLSQIQENGMKIHVHANVCPLSLVPLVKFGTQIHANVFVPQQFLAIPLLTLLHQL